MVYGDDFGQVQAALKLKIDDIKSHKNDDSSDSPSKTSLNNIIEPLKELNRDLCKCRQFNLFKAVLDLPDKIGREYVHFRLRQLITHFLKYAIIIV